MINYHSIEIIAALLGLVAVWLCARESILNWPLSMATGIAYFFVFYHARLYADMFVQIIFFILQCVGWWYWYQGGEQGDGIAITHITLRYAMSYFTLFVILTYLFGWILAHYSDGQWVYLDTGLTVASLITEYFLAKKICENWLCWIAIDMIYTVFFIDLRLYASALLYLVLTIIALTAYYQWRTRTKPLVVA